MINKKILIGVFLLAGIFLILLTTFVLAAGISSPQFSAPGSVGYLRGQGVDTFPIFNPDMCGKGQDFVLQIAPFGCSPAIVRSDLLEEQNVPVFCQIAATKINPLIDVEAIESMSFKGQYPKEVAGIGFHPARAAVKSQKTLLNSPVLNNIGYAVIVLRQQEKESEMPDFVQGELTAQIKYDIENAFGIGKANYYVPELNDEQWSERYKQYGFWNGKGFLRAESIDADSAVVSIYSDENNKISTFNLKKGQTSDQVYLPGFYCLANLKIRLDGLEAPNTRAKLEINGEIVEVAEKEKFLENACRVIGEPKKEGINQKVEISCRTDEGVDRFELRIAPKIKLDIEGEEKKEFVIGDKLYKNNDKFVYLAYAGTGKNKGGLISLTNSNDEKDLFVFLIEIPLEKEKLSDSEISSMANLVKRSTSSKTTGVGITDALVNAAKFYSSTAETIFKYFATGQEHSFVFLGDAKKIAGTNVQLLGFSGAKDKSFGNLNGICVSNGKFDPSLCKKGDSLNIETFDEETKSSFILKKTDNNIWTSKSYGPYSDSAITLLFNSGEIKEYVIEENLYPSFNDYLKDLPKSSSTENSELKQHYDNAMKDYRKIINSFPNEKQDQNSQKTFGEQALFNAIGLADSAEQKKKMIELCQEFEEMYPNSKEPAVCGNALEISNSEVSSNSVFVNGGVKEISFKGIYEPSHDEYSAEIIVKMPDGSREFFPLRKNQVIYLDEFVEIKDIDRIFKVIQGREEIYFRFVKNIWKWSENSDEDFEDVKERVKDLAGIGISAVISNDNNLLLIEKLFKVKNDFEKGKNIILKEKGTIIKGNEFIQLISLDSDSVRLNVNLNADTTLDKITKATISSSNKKLKKDVGDSFGSNYVFTLTKVNLKNVAKISVLPGIDNAGTEANISFNIGIEKRGIQLSPDEIKDKIGNLDKSIEKWEGTSESLGNVVRGFNAACLMTGTYLTVSNFFSNLDGKSIARKEVMRIDGGWTDICKDALNTGELNGKKVDYNSLDHCFSENNGDIEKDVEAVFNIIESQKSINDDNLCDKLESIRNVLGSSVTIKDPKDNTKTKVIEIAEKKDIYAAFEKDSKTNKCEKISLSEAKDLERLNLILDSGATEKFKEAAKINRFRILSNIKSNSKDYANILSLQKDIEGSDIDLKMKIRNYGGQDSIPGIYDGDVIKKTQINCGDCKTDGEGPSSINFKDKTDYPIQIITLSGIKYLLVLNGQNSDYSIEGAENGVYEFDGISEDKTKVKVKKTSNADLVLKRFNGFKKYDSSSWNNPFKTGEAKVRYFETEPYKGSPAIVPFDTKNGWYVQTKQTLPGFGKLRAYDDSGRVASFWLCNVGENGKIDGLDRDDCQQFNPGTGQIVSTFQGLNPADTTKFVQCAIDAIGDAQKSYKSNVQRVNINTACGKENIEVGEPAIDVPDVQCQDFMSPKECLLLFNACDPVVCPSSRCDLGGTYPVADVVQSGIVGSLALCLPNIKEDIYVPICLSGVKAGMDSLISVQKNYRDCLQENLDTGKTIGICDEYHSIYLCDFFWSQAAPLSQIAIPKIFEFFKGELGSRGGGEYLGVKTAWKNAQNSADFMTQYYGANSFQAFNSKATESIGKAVCRNFVSGTVPSDIGLEGLIEPRSPPQYSAWFSEQIFTTATVPATSQYKVFFHIYAGENNLQNVGAYYSVYLKSPEGTSFYQTNPTVAVASGYIAKGDYASETKDFTAPSGYKELCIRVNAQEECGFKQVSTEFGLNYLNDQYMKEQASQTDIDSETACVSGTPSFYSLATPNLQAGVTEVIDPALYDRGIVRVCSTDNPGKGTDAEAGTKSGRWQEVGNCDDGKGKIKCYIDTNSVKDVIKSSDIENQTLNAATKNLKEKLKEGEITTKSFIDTLKEKSPGDIIKMITDEVIDKAVLSYQRAKLLITRGDAYRDLVGRPAPKSAIQSPEPAVSASPTEAPDPLPEEVKVEDRKDVSYNWDKNDAEVEFLAIINNNVDGGFKVPDGCKKYADLIFEASETYKIPNPLLLLSIMIQENNCNVQDGKKGEIGLMQISKKTFDDICKDKMNINFEDLEREGSAKDNIECGTMILKNKYKEKFTFKKAEERETTSCKRDKDTIYYGWEAALRGYNGWGCGNDNYVEQVMDRYKELSNINVPRSTAIN